MNTPNVDAGRLERRVRRVGNKTIPGFMDFAPFLRSAQYAEYRYCAERPWLRMLGFVTSPQPTALFIHSVQYAEYHYCALPR